MLKRFIFGTLLVFCALSSTVQESHALDVRDILLMTKMCVAGGASPWTTADGYGSIQFSCHMIPAL